MNLRLKIPLLIAVTLIALVAVTYVTMHFILMKSIVALEERDVGRNLERVSDAINNELIRLNSTTGDYASWDDTYKFIQERNPDYIKTNVNAETMINLKINLFVLFDLRGKFVYGTGIDLAAGQIIPLSGIERQGLTLTPRLLDHKGLDSHINGLLLLPRAPLLFASRPIITSNYEGPIRGSLVTGKYLDSTEIMRLSAVTHLSFNLCRADSAGLECPLEILVRLNSGKRFVVLPQSADTALGFALIRDFAGKPALVIKLSAGREVYKQGLRTLRYFLIALVIIGIFFLGLALLLLETQILRRLSRLMQDVRIIKSSRSLQSRVTLHGKDEIAAVGGEINRMLEAIEKSSVEIRESEKKFRLTFESSKNAILWIDVDTGTIVNCNRESERLFEKTKLDLIGQPHAPLFPPGKAPSESQKIRAQSDKNEGFEIETEVLSGPDRTKNVIISTSVTSFGGKRFIQEVYRDVTRQQQIEREHTQLEDQLRQSQKMEVIGQLAGGIAHDFNNMLAGISGYSDLIRRKFTAENPVLGRYATTIFDTAKNAAELTAKLLAFARKGKHELVVVSIHDIIQDVIKLLEHSIDKRIRIIQYLRALPATVIGDRTQLQNALLNLCMNASDAMPEGGELVLSTENFVIDDAYMKQHPYKLVEGPYVMLAVTDNGTGMDANVKAKLFEPFFTTKGPGKGTGLGLASVYGTVKSHNGSIECYSEMGKGTAFKIYLPLADKQGEKVSPQEKIFRGSGRILLVDDEKLVRDVTSDILAELGYSVTAVNDGVEAVEFYREHQGEIDLVILDIIMPRMGGFDCFMQLKKINPAVKVIVSSGYSMNNESARLLSFGACGFVGKPFDIGKLSKTLNDALSR